jgi:hypothetical protein
MKKTLLLLTLSTALLLPASAFAKSVDNNQEIKSQIQHYFDLELGAIKSKDKSALVGIQKIC